MLYFVSKQRFQWTKVIVYDIRFSTIVTMNNLRREVPAVNGTSNEDFDMEVENIEDLLYELFVYSEWRPDPEFIRGDTGIRNSAQLANRILGIFKPEESLIEQISNYIDQLQSWQICLGDDGKVVAVLQDTVLEIRTKRGNYCNAVAKTTIVRDPNPQWRKMAWSPDCSLLAVAHSNGKISFYDLLAINLFNIQPDCSQPMELQCIDTTHAVAGLIFLSNRITDHKWSSELILVDYKGSLRSFLVSPTDGFKLHHRFTFEGGISTLSYHPNHNLIFISSLPSIISQENHKPANYGLQSWRLLNDPPFYKLSIDYNKQLSIKYTSWILYNMSFWKKANQNAVTKAVISSDGRFLGCIHISGSISVWQLPILKQLKYWPLNMQPDFDKSNPLIMNTKQKGWPVLKNGFSVNSPLDINWWDNETLIISRINGSVSICSMISLNNMLTNKPVFFQGHPQITNTFDNGFLALECESTAFSANKLYRNSDSEYDLTDITKELSDDEHLDSLEIDKISFLSRCIDVLKVVLYIITDMERFQPKPKKISLLCRIYRLLCLKSTTPDDLYLRKIENAEYEEALSLAETYNLDSDLVYQQQWRCAKVSTQSIKDFLNKVSKKMWVIQQCCDRVPESLDSAKELLEFGLKITNKEIFNSLNSDVDKKTFYEKKLWDKVTLEELTAQSSEILRYRYAMLFFLDRLEIYKAIIRSEASPYSAEEYNRFRSSTIYHSAIEFAKEGRIEALLCLWRHLPNISLRLMVLQNIPETIHPNTYRALLPDNKSMRIALFQKSHQRNIDWCESDNFRSIWNSVEIDDFSYEDLVDEMESPLPQDVNLSEWYSTRTHQIDKMCGLSSHSLTLIEIAIEKNIPDLEELHSLLITLDVLLYENNIDSLNLEQLEKYSQFEIANHIMSKTSHETIVEDIQRLLLPYLNRCEKLSSVMGIKKNLLNEYIVDLSKRDLSLVLVIFQNINKIEFNVQDCLELAEKCFTVQENNDQLQLYFDILDVLPESSDDSITPSNLHKTLDDMERHLDACNLMKKYNVDVTYSQIKLLSKTPKEIEELLIRVARNSSKCCNNSADWNNLLNDVLNLHSLLSSSSDNDICYEVFATSLISSGSKLSIVSAEQILDCQSNNTTNIEKDQKPPNKNKFPYKFPVSYKIAFEKSLSFLLNGAREYINSSSSLNDPSLELAWTCLQLVKEENIEIQYEKDLILALKILHDFELSVLPVQVRLYPSKLEFIEECLNCNEVAYKSVDKVLQLAKLLGVAGEDEKRREVTMVSLCAIKSLEAEDYEEAKKLAKRLVTVTEGPSSIHATKAAQELGSNSHISDLPLRQQLLNVALLHCDPQYIENLLLIRSTVESEILQNEINNLVSVTTSNTNKRVNLQDSMESTEDDYVDALTSPIVENKIITAVQAVEKYIPKPLNVFGERSIWKNALSYRWNSFPEKSSTNAKNCGKLAVPSFYANLHNDCHISLLNTQYDRFSTPDIFDPQLVILFSLIRNDILQNCIKYGDCEVTYTEALTQCAEYTLTEDTAYCISQLLSVYNHRDFDRSFQNIDVNVKNVACITYFYALLNYIVSNPTPDEGFLLPPIKLISNCFKNIKNSSSDFQNDPLKEISLCKNVMNQLMEGRKLAMLGCNIDIEVFAQDPIYRESIVLNFSKTNDNEKIKLAIELAKKYGIKENNILINHISYIILNYKAQDIKESIKRISSDDLKNIFSNDITNITERLVTEIWDKLDGKEHKGLILFYTLMENIDSKYTMNGITAKEHLKLLKKTKSSCSDIDYKFLLNSPSQNELFKVLAPFLSKDNIGLVTKLLRTLPPSFNFTLNSSNFYCEWLLKYFFNVPENLQSNKKWMQQYRECSSYFSKLNKNDILAFATNLLFSETSLQKIPSSCRIQIAYQTAEYCQHEHNNETSCKQSESNTWEETGNKIYRWGKFLEDYHSEPLKQIIQNSPELPTQLWREIEKTYGEECSLDKSLSKLLLHKDLPINNFLSVLNILNTQETINDLLMNIVQTSEIDENSLPRIIETLIIMKSKDISVDELLLEKLKPYTTSPLISSKQRLDLMSLYKTQFNDDDSKIREKLSKEIILKTWGENIFIETEDMIIDQTARNNIFIKLIQNDTNWEKLKIIVDLINMWPLYTDENKDNVPHILLIKKMIKNEDNLEDNVPLLKLLMEKQRIREEDVRWIIADKSVESTLGKIWLCLISSNENNYHQYLLTLASDLQHRVTDEKYLTDSLLTEILKKKLFTTFVKTNLYPRLVQYLFKQKVLTLECSYNVETAITDLLKEGFIAEAGALKMNNSGIPRALRDFTASLTFKKI